MQVVAAAESARYQFFASETRAKQVLSNLRVSAATGFTEAKFLAHANASGRLSSASGLDSSLRTPFGCSSRTWTSSLSQWSERGWRRHVSAYLASFESEADDNLSIVGGGGGAD